MTPRHAIPNGPMAEPMTGAGPTTGAEPATVAEPAALAQSQPRNPLHGVTLASMLVEMVAYFGWDELARQVPLRCFTSEPSLTSSLKLLRKTPWARAKVESLYLFMKREQARTQRAGPGR